MSFLAPRVALRPAPPSDRPPFRWPIRVYWEDTDAGGIVFYANWLKFFERARTEWLRSLGHEQEALRVASGTVFVVSETAVRYLRPARLDDVVEVTVEVRHAGRAQLTIDQRAWRRTAPGDGGTATEQALAEGTIRIACVNAATLRPCRVPDAIFDAVVRPAAPSPVRILPILPTPPPRRPPDLSA